MTVLHYITGMHAGVFEGKSQYDTSLLGLSLLYGVSWQEIAQATMGTTSGKAIDSWLSNNGGVPVPAGWSFAPGMIAKIPGVSRSLSPVPPAGGQPAGPRVTPGEADGSVADPSTGQVPNSRHAAVGGDNTLMLLLSLGALWFLLSKDAKKRPKRRRKTKKKRKTVRRRRRR